MSSVSRQSCLPSLISCCWDDVINVAEIRKALFLLELGKALHSYSRTFKVGQTGQH